MPFEKVLKDILMDMKDWLLALGGVIAVLVNVGRAIKYQGATASEKAEIVVGIRNSMLMIFGAFFLAWLAIYVYDKIKVVV